MFDTAVAQVVTWGHAAFGGDSSAIQEQVKMGLNQGFGAWAFLGVRGF